MTATALRLEDNPSAAEIIAALEAAERRPDEALRAAVGRAGEIAPAVIELLDHAASGACIASAAGKPGILGHSRSWRGAPEGTLSFAPALPARGQGRRSRATAWRC